jgi:hypothetical protein
MKSILLKFHLNRNISLPQEHAPAQSSGIGEDTWHGLAEQNVISFVALIYSVTEWAQ